MNIHEKIISKRKIVSSYLSKQIPKNKLLINTAIVCGIVGTAFAGIPAAGGKPAVDALSTSWQFLCIGASVFTLIATVATTLRNNYDTTSKISKAQICNAKLEMLELLLAEGLIETKQAIERYGEYVADIAFIEETAMDADSK